MVLAKIFMVWVFTFPMEHALCQTENDPPFPRLANYYLYNFIRAEDVHLFSGWDLFVFDYGVDNTSGSRDNVSSIKDLNPDIIFLAYHLSNGVDNNRNPPDPTFTAAQEHDWWLYDEDENILTGGGIWSYQHLLNMTNTEAASGSHPQGVKPNEFLAEDLVTNHLARYDYWDGIFYDVFSDNLEWIHTDIKDATRNRVAEFDSRQNENEPLFQDLWRSGMLKLLQNTLDLHPRAALIGNGLHKTATPYLNGKMYENYVASRCELSDLAPEYKYINETEREHAMTIINGMPESDADPSDYSAMRFSLISALLIGAYYSFDFGSQHHAETLWFDEYSVLPNGEVAARTTNLTENINSTQQNIPVSTTEGFPEKGVILIDSEQIYYDSKTTNSFHAIDQFGRGYPSHTGKYDLRAPHTNGVTVIYYLNSNTEYLGYPDSDAYDASDPSVKLKDYFKECGWFCSDELEENINSRVWRRDFDHGTAILNPTEESKTIDGLGNGRYKKVRGHQDPSHNNGQLVDEVLTIAPKDGFILIRVVDNMAPEPPANLEIIE